MGVIIRTPYCTDSHLDFFVRNLTVCKGDLVASANGVVSQPIRLDAGGSPDADEPLTLLEAKRQIRYDLASTADDDDVYAWIRSAFRKIEGDTGVVPLTSRWSFAVEAFPDWRQPLRLPLWPIQSVDRIAYYDTDGTLVELAAGSPGQAFILDQGSRPARLALERDTDEWPTNMRTFQPGLIEVTAGFTSAAAYPDDLKQAAKILIGQSALFREQDVAGAGMTLSAVSVDYQKWIERWVLPGV